eukprot:379464-Ditylum_brightwellii.AAC.1
MDQCEDCSKVVCSSCSALMSCKFCGCGLCKECATNYGHRGIALCACDAKFAMECDTFAPRSNKSIVALANWKK